MSTQHYQIISCVTYSISECHWTTSRRCCWRSFWPQTTRKTDFHGWWLTGLWSLPKIARKYRTHSISGNKEKHGQNAPKATQEGANNFADLDLVDRVVATVEITALYQPKLYNNSLSNSTCFNQNCTFVHLSQRNKLQTSLTWTFFSKPLPTRTHFMWTQTTSSFHQPNKGRASSLRFKVDTYHAQQAAGHQRSSPPTPANYPLRQQNRLPIPVAPVNNNSSEILRMLQNMKNNF